MDTVIPGERAVGGRGFAVLVRRCAGTTRRHIIRVLTEILAHWNRQPFDRFWPPHP